MSNEALGMLVFAVMVGFACGIVSMIIAEKKRRSPGGFFLVGFFFGPLGVLVTVLVARGEPAPPAGMRAVTCPRCTARQNVAEDQADYECWQCKLVSPAPAVKPDWREWLGKLAD
ncbi:hypothetical protein ACFVH4_30080 [Nocardia ignorata]|uniref:hypothetical protein n=1 Tax=Nocardia ignorata TaxID=145285 RepID=UPI00362B612D